MDDLDDDEVLEEFIPPSPLRVARRALTLTAVIDRGNLERAELSKDAADAQHQDLIGWAKEDHDLTTEFEKSELEFLESAVGALDEQSMINASWRIEGLAILAWALNLVELPVYDQTVNSTVIMTSVIQAAKTILQNPKLRDADEIGKVSEQIFSLRWRLREPRNGQALDFARVAEGNWFLSSDISSFRLIDRDIALGDTSVSQAPPAVLQSAVSCTMERDRAIRWLYGAHEIYSEVDLST